MANAYISFLNLPSASALAPNATLHYITTTTSIHDADAIIKHLQAQDKVVKKKAETVLNSIATNDAIVVETETELEFVRGGGTFLPNMDDNMLIDSLVTVPIVHIVQLDDSGKISQIRLHWDQSTMLRQVDAIGRTGRNWPIRDGKAMTKLIKSSASAVGSSAAPKGSSGAPSKPNEVVITHRPGSKESRDDEHKHFQSRLFATGDDENAGSSSNRESIPVRTSAKPAPRQWGELFAGDGARPSATPTNKNAGADRKFGQNRLFDENTNDRSPSPNTKKADPTKYNHFSFGNGEEAEPIDGNRPPSAKAQKHMKNWNFEDFSTPPKVAPKHQPEFERHIGHGIDEDEPPTPAKRPIVHAPRPDADAHFTMTDDSPAGHRPQPRTTRPGALDSHFKAENGVLTAEETGKKPLGTNVNSSNIRRGPDINTHYTSTDASPGVSTDENARVDDDRQVGRNANSKSRLDNDQAHWRLDDTPEKSKQIYKTAGNGMGGRKGAAGRSWTIGNDEEAEPVKEAKIYKTYGNGMGGRAGAAPSWSWGDRDDEVEDDSKKSKIYKTAGDGMGGRSH